MDSLHTVKLTNKMLTIIQLFLQNKLGAGAGSAQLLSHVQLFATPWAVAHQACP